MITIHSEPCIRCGQCALACPMGIIRMEEGAPKVGREKRCIRCMHCSAACPVQAVAFSDLDEAALYPPRSDDPLAALIQSRRSIRHFLPTPPDRPLIERAMKQAAWAPSAKNARGHRFLILYGRQATDRAAQMALDYAKQIRQAPELLLAAKGGLNLVTCGAPCAVLCCTQEGMGIIDSAIALSTLELLLVQGGIGTCWGGYLARLSSAAPELRAWLGLEEGWQIPCALMIGYPDRERYPNLPPRSTVDLRWIGPEQSH